MAKKEKVKPFYLIVFDRYLDLTNRLEELKIKKFEKKPPIDIDNSIKEVENDIVSLMEEIKDVRFVKRNTTTV